MSISLKTKTVVGLLFTSAAIALVYPTEDSKIEKSEATVGNACHKLEGMNDDQALKCVSATWNHANLVSRLVDNGTLATAAMRAACQDKPLPEAKFQQGLISGLKKDTAACFSAIDHSLGVAVQSKTGHYKEVATQARYATERAHVFLPPQYN